MTRVIKPPIPYFGGKQRIASQIVALFPEHRHYVEPYAGGLSVLLAKPPSRFETVNDIDGDLMTFWRVLRDQPEELERACALTPHSRLDFERSRDVEGLPDLERARRVWLQLTQGRSARRTATGWRFVTDGDSAVGLGMPEYLAGYVKRLSMAAQRLSRVSLECRDALDVIRVYGAHEANLLYVDPPYMPETRDGLAYKHEADADHQERLAEALNDCRAKVVLSGYGSERYATWYGHWPQSSVAASTTQGTGDHARVEVLWTNFKPHPTLFDFGEPA